MRALGFALLLLIVSCSAKISTSVKSLPELGQAWHPKGAVFLHVRDGAGKENYWYSINCARVTYTITVDPSCGKVIAMRTSDRAFTSKDGLSPKDPYLKVQQMFGNSRSEMKYLSVYVHLTDDWVAAFAPPRNKMDCDPSEYELLVFEKKLTNGCH
jgi:hypothetical protein